MLKKLFSNTIIYSVAPQISKLASFFVLPIITKDLTDLDYGISGVLFAYTSAISVFAELGLKIVLVNFFFKSPSQYKWAWRQIYGFLTLWNIVYSVLLAVLIFLVTPIEAIENRWVIILLNVGPLVFFGQTSMLAYLYYQINQKPFAIALRTAIFGFLTVILNLYFISVLKQGYMGWFYSIFIVGILTNISYWYPLNISLKITPIFNFKWRLIKKGLSVSLPTIPHYYSSYLLNSSDRLSMDVLNVETRDIGRYNIAYMFGSIVENIGMALGMSISPVVMRMYKENNDEGAKKIIFFSQGAFLFGTFFVCLWLKEIFFVLVKNNTLSAMYPLAVVIIMSYNYRPMYLGASNKLFFTENTQSLWKISFVAGLINVVLNLLFIPFLGFQFAAVSTFVAFMYMGYAGYYLDQFKAQNQLNYQPLTWLSLTILITLIAYYAVDISICFKFWISASLTIAGALLFLHFKKRIVL